MHYPSFQVFSLDHLTFQSLFVGLGEIETLILNEIDFQKIEKENKEVIVYYEKAVTKPTEE